MRDHRKYHVAANIVIIYYNIHPFGGNCCIKIR